MAERFYVCKEEDCNTAFMIDCSASELDDMKVCKACGSRNVDLDFSDGKGSGYKNLGLDWGNDQTIYGGGGNTRR